MIRTPLTITDISGILTHVRFLREQGIQAYQIEHTNQMAQGMHNSQIDHLKQERDHKKLEKQIMFLTNIVVCTYSVYPGL